MTPMTGIAATSDRAIVFPASAVPRAVLAMDNGRVTLAEGRATLTGPSVRPG
ncbi:hypothetical protein [Sphingomonas yantingensis]|uniref:Uncharacterized protein n=1 Tax=Sphingomonas yantingensis TaxID=1241761 RepID=A0A7W9ARU5_9SPHN|nr:hypothetical protein [Sphingomonas yantingensis]MBB5699311.1 hypothetical protein [Sphingomonas yantingensis]